MPSELFQIALDLFVLAYRPHFLLPQIHFHRLSKDLRMALQEIGSLLLQIYLSVRMVLG